MLICIDEELYISNSSITLKHFPQYRRTTELKFYLLVHCFSLKIKEIPYCIKEMSSDQP